jgi:hypothetical protein
VIALSTEAEPEVLLSLSLSGSEHSDAARSPYQRTAMSRFEGHPSVRAVELKRGDIVLRLKLLPPPPLNSADSSRT